VYGTIDWSLLKQPDNQKTTSRAAWPSERKPRGIYVREKNESNEA
jgi:hypothetical protein